MKECERPGNALEALMPGLAGMADGTTQTNLGIIMVPPGFGIWGVVQCMWVQSMWTGNNCGLFGHGQP